MMVRSLFERIWHHNIDGIDKEMFHLSGTYADN